MTHHVFEMPVSAAHVRELKIGDTVTLEKTLYGIRDATLIHMFDRGRRTRFDLNGHAVIHTAPNVHRVEKSDKAPAGYEPFCIGTTTSQRMERFTRPLMEREGVRIIIGKGGMAQGTLGAFAELGGAYLAIVGGAAALETTWIEEIEDVDMDDLHPEKSLALPHPQFRSAARRHGFAWRLDVRRRARRRRRAPQRGSGKARNCGVTGHACKPVGGPSPLVGEGGPRVSAGRVRGKSLNTPHPSLLRARSQVFADCVNLSATDTFSRKGRRAR